jgi:hypothetical protein
LLPCKHSATCSHEINIVLAPLQTFCSYSHANICLLPYNQYGSYSLASTLMLPALQHCMHLQRRAESMFLNDPYSVSITCSYSIWQWRKESEL